MNRKVSLMSGLVTGTMAAAVVLLLVARSWAHCDTLRGPVIQEAKAALEKGDATSILKWVKKENEAEIRAAFAKAVAVRREGAEARELADQYFFETLVRVHRAGEGAPFTGIKDESVEPIIALADKALAEGSAEKMIEEMSAEMAAGIKDKLQKAVEAKKHADESIEAGREYVEAYVTYMHYVEGIQAAIGSGGGHEGHSEGGSDGGDSAGHEGDKVR